MIPAGCQTRGPAGNRASVTNREIKLELRKRLELAVLDAFNGAVREVTQRNGRRFEGLVRESQRKG
jgi:hypothetical protein